jgi:hypothetical protein
LPLSGTSNICNIFVILQDRCLENVKIKATFISFDYIAITCFILNLKGEKNDSGKGATFHGLCPFCREASEFRSEWGIETAGVK